MRYNVGRYVVMLMVLVGVVGGSVASLVVGNTASASVSVAQGLAWGETMTLGQWSAERGSQAEEDSEAWDCRVMGNTQCGDTWYELVCPDAPQVPTLLCSLEPHKARATRYV